MPPIVKARSAGILYSAILILAGFNLFYIPAACIVPADPAPRRPQNHGRTNCFIASAFSAPPILCLAVICSEKWAKKKRTLVLRQLTCFHTGKIRSGEDRSRHHS